MHYCLQVTELLYYIFGWHATRSAGAQGSRTLYSLALTCRAFQQPALDILWEDMKGSLAPLIKCLPSDVWEKRPGEEILERGQLFLRKPLTRGHLCTLRSYASRIQTLGCRGVNTNEDVAAETFQTLSFCIDAPFLPNLRELAWIWGQDDMFPYIRLFLGGTKLRCLSMPIRAPELWTLSLLPRLGDMHPSMECFETYMTYLPSPPSNSTIEVVSDLVSRWDRLEKLTCGPLTRRALSHLATLPNLRTLSLDLSSHPPIMLSTPPSPFSALQCLELKAHSIALCTPLISLVTSCTTVKLCITSSTITTISTFKDLYGIFGSSFPSLSSIQFAEFLSPQPAHLPDGPMIDIDTIRPLLDLTHLTCVQLNPVCAFSLDDDRLTELALAWPALQELDLGTRHGWRRGTKVTLRGLLLLIKNCPKLDSLGIVINATKIDSHSPTRPGGGVQNDAITELSLGDSTIDYSDHVAAFLSDILPKVEYIDHHWGSSESRIAKKYKRHWDTVGRLLSLFAMVREQERNWKGNTRLEGAEVAISPGPVMMRQPSSYSSGSSTDSTF